MKHVQYTHVLTNDELVLDSPRTSSARIIGDYCFQQHRSDILCLCIHLISKFSILQSSLGDRWKHILYRHVSTEEKFEDFKWGIIISVNRRRTDNTMAKRKGTNGQKKRRESKMDRQHTSQTKKDKQRFSNLYIENQRSSNMNPT